MTSYQKQGCAKLSLAQAMILRQLDLAGAVG
jgi:hypothetical protein